MSEMLRDVEGLSGVFLTFNKRQLVIRPFGEQLQRTPLYHETVSVCCRANTTQMQVSRGKCVHMDARVSRTETVSSRVGQLSAEWQNTREQLKIREGCVYVSPPGIFLLWWLVPYVLPVWRNNTE